MTQYNNIFTKNVYDLGVFVGRYGLGTAKRVKNIPDGTPVFMYTWVEDAILLDHALDARRPAAEAEPPGNHPGLQEVDSFARRLGWRSESSNPPYLSERSSVVLND